MKRIVIIGPAGSGKSTFARLLGKDLDIEVTHLDWLFWSLDWKPAAAPEFERAQRAIVQRNAWIFDGNFERSLHIRADRADTIVVLDPPIWVCLRRLLRRAERPDQPAAMPAFRSRRRYALFLALTAAYPILWRRRLIRRVRDYEGATCHVAYLRTDRDVLGFLREVSGSIEATS